MLGLLFFSSCEWEFRFFCEGFKDVVLGWGRVRFRIL